LVANADGTRRDLNPVISIKYIDCFSESFSLLNGEAGGYITKNDVTLLCVAQEQTMSESKLVQALGIFQDGGPTRWHATGFVPGVGWLEAWGTSLIEAMEALQQLAEARTKSDVDTPGSSRTGQPKEDSPT
jgi:hypothetical protein